MPRLMTQTGGIAPTEHHGTLRLEAVRMAGGDASGLAAEIADFLINGLIGAAGQAYLVGVGRPDIVGVEEPPASAPFTLEQEARIREIVAERSLTPDQVDAIGRVIREAAAPTLRRGA